MFDMPITSRPTAPKEYENLETIMHDVEWKELLMCFKSGASRHCSEK